MKRTLLTVISVCLVLASLFGIYAGVVGTDDISAIVRYTGSQRNVVSDIADETEKGIEQLEADADKHKQDILDATEGTVVDQVGSGQLEQGEKEYNAGKDKLNAGRNEYNEGKKQYEEAKALYDEKYAQYEDACKQLDAAKVQLEDAKAQRDAGQEKLDNATPVYNLIKQYVNLADGKVYEWTKYLADPIAQNYGYASAEAVVVAYEEGQAQIAEANIQIADAEKQIADAEAQLADAKVQLDDGKKQLQEAKAQLDDAEAQLEAGQKQLDAAKAQLDAGRATVNESVEELEAALEDLKAYDDAESKVKAGVAQLMKTPAIAEAVEDESDYRSVIEAARDFVDSNKDGVNEEMTVRQSLYVMLIAASVLCALAGVVGLIAAFVPTSGKLNIAMTAAVAAAALSAGFLIYGLLNGSRDFAYSYMDSLGNVAGDGGLQSTAFILLVVFSVSAAAIAIMCRNAYRRVLFGSPVESAPTEDAPVPEAERADAPAPEREPEAESEIAAEETTGMSIEQLAAETRRLNEEAVRMEESAQLEALKKAQREYEEAKKRFEAARKAANNK